MHTCTHVSVFTCTRAHVATLVSHNQGARGDNSGKGQSCCRRFPKLPCSCTPTCRTSCTAVMGIGSPLASCFVCVAFGTPKRSRRRHTRPKAQRDCRCPVVCCLVGTKSHVQTHTNTHKRMFRIACLPPLGGLLPLQQRLRHVCQETKNKVVVQPRATNSVSLCLHTTGTTISATP